MALLWFEGPPWLSFVYPLIAIIQLCLHIALSVGAVLAAIDAISRRADSFAAADRQTKGVWTAITVACVFSCALGWYGVGSFTPVGLLWLVTVVGVLVYLLDVRPKLRQVQRGSGW